MKKELADSKRYDGKRPIVIFLGYLMILFLILLVLGAIAFYVYFVFLGKKVSNVDTNVVTSQPITKTLSQGMQALPDGWIKYSNNELNASFEYPRDWQLRNNNDIIEIKKYNGAEKEATSLAKTFSIGRIANNTYIPIKRILQADNRDSQVIKETTDSGETIYESEHGIDELNLHKVSHYWIKGQWIYFIDATYFNKVHDHEQDPESKRLIESFKTISE